MKNIDRFREALEFIGERHRKAYGTELEFLGRIKGCLVSAIRAGGNIELRMDLKSLGMDLDIGVPDFFPSWPGIGCDCPGFAWTGITKEWCEAEYDGGRQSPASMYPRSPGFWRCTDEMFETRVGIFNSAIGDMKKAYGK